MLFNRKTNMYSVDLDNDRIRLSEHKQHDRYCSLRNKSLNFNGLSKLE